MKPAIAVQYYFLISKPKLKGFDFKMVGGLPGEGESSISDAIGA